MSASDLFFPGRFFLLMTNDINIPLHQLSQMADRPRMCAHTETAHVHGSAPAVIERAPAAAAATAGEREIQGRVGTRGGGGDGWRHVPALNAASAG